jgi:hypothetical protein
LHPELISMSNTGMGCGGMGHYWGPPTPGPRYTNHPDEIIDTVPQCT